MKAASMGMALVLALSAFLGVPEPARASHHKLDVDIDDLDAEIRWDGQKWSLRVKYEVDIENAAPGEAFDLVLNLVSRSGSGQPVQIVVPLVTPSEVDDDEFEYKSILLARLTPVWWAIRTDSGSTRW